MAQTFVVAVNYPRLVPVRVFTATSDHPWSDETNLISGRGSTSIMGKRLTTALLASFFLFSYTNSFAQTRVVVIDPDAPSVAEQSKAELETAKDFQDFLARLQKLAYDYQGYFSKFSEYQAKEYQALLQKLILSMNEGKFCGDPERLLDEMEYLKDVLEQSEDEIEPENRNYKLQSLSRSLQRDLEIMIDELNEQIMTEMHQDISRDLVTRYMQLERQSSLEAKEIYLQTLANHKELAKQIEEAIKSAQVTKKAALTEKQIEALRKLEKLEEEIEEWDLIELDSGRYLVRHPRPPDAMDLPHPPPVIVMTTPKDRIEYVKPGTVISYREFLDSVRVSSSSLPVFVNSETGDLKITGWNNDMVMVKFKVEIAAESDASAESFANDIQVKLSANEKGVYVKAQFPSLSDPKRKILTSTFDVRVPARNTVISENSFGTVKVSNLQNGLRLNTSYCDVDLDDIRGDIEVVSKMNTLKVANSYGQFTLHNSMGSINVSASSGEFDIENAYSPVELTQCEGPALVRNSGLVSIREHSGKVTVVNTNGTVELTDVTGDLSAKNAYKPIIVSDIRGSVILENMSGAIDLSEISGRAAVSNRFGPITSRYVGGPIEINNEAGTTMIDISHALAGPSYVIANTGTVRLNLSRQSDVLLTVTTEGGSIIGSKGNPIHKDGLTSSLQMTYGAGSIPLKVTGSNSTVVISEDNGI